MFRCMHETITVQGETYTVDRTCDSDGRPRVFLLDSRGLTAASVYDTGGRAWMLGTPLSWAASDIRETLRRLGY